MSVLHRPSYYAGAPVGYQPAPCHQWLIDTCAEAVAPDPQYFDAIRTLNPTKPTLYAYTSATDDYIANPDGTPHKDFLRVKACADALAVPIETMYLHWAEDTTTTVWISGPGPTPKFYPAGSRIEMYAGGHQSGGMLRELCSFVPAACPVQTDAMMQAAKAKSPKGREWDGLMLDNCGNVLYNWGDPLVSGGTVLECGLKIGSAAFNGWYWQNMRDWLVTFRAAMQGAGKLLAQNISNSWTDELVTHGTADRLICEFVGNPIRDSWPGILEAARRNRLADEAGMGIWYSCNPALGSPAESWNEMQYAALCFHLAVMSPRTSTHIQDWTGPYSSTPIWPQRVTSPVESHPQFRLLGNPTGPVELVGTRGPSTRLQKLYMRPFDRGGVWVRQMEPYNGLTTETWDVSVGPQMIYLPPDGTTPNPRPTTVAIKNGGGAIMIRA